MITVLKTTNDIVEKCLESTYLQRDGSLNYFYIYIHYDGNIPFYIGQGSHNRAYKYKGRSKDWYDKYSSCKNFNIRIIVSNLSYQTSIEVENNLIEQYKNTLINKDFGGNPNQSFTILCFTKKGKLVRKYNNAEETLMDGFNPNSVRTQCNQNQNRRTYKNYVWCYEKDYKKFKHTLFIEGKTSKKWVKIIFPDNTYKIYQSINSTKEDGFLPAKVREVCLGTRKSHRNCKCEFLNL